MVFTNITPVVEIYFQQEKAYCNLKLSIHSSMGFVFKIQRKYLYSKEIIITIIDSKELF